MMGLVTRLNWRSCSFILDFLSIIRHFAVVQNIFGDRRDIVVHKVVSVIMLLVVAHQLVELIEIDKFWSICLTTSLVTSVWLGVNTSEETWFNFEDVLTSGDNHVIIGLLGADDDTVLVVQVRMTHDECLGIGIVLHQLEVISSLPVVLFLENVDVLEVLLGQLDDTGSVLHVESGVSHHDVIKHFNLLELVVQVLRELDIADTIAIQAEGEILLQPSESLWLPFHVNIEPVVAFLTILYLDVSVTILTSDFGINECASHKAVGSVFLDHVEDAVSVLVASSSWKKS